MTKAEELNFTKKRTENLVLILCLGDFREQQILLSLCNNLSKMVSQKEKKKDKKEGEKEMGRKEGRKEGREGKVK
jgi:hypothetical protein